MVVLPTLTPVQGLAALAVHDPEADFDAAVATMSAAAGHVRHAAVRLADDGTGVLGLVAGEVLERGESADVVTQRVVGRLLAGGGDLLTLVLGAEIGRAHV